MRLVNYPTEEPTYPQELDDAYYEFAHRVCKTTLDDIEFEKRYTILNAALIHLRVLIERPHRCGSKEHLEVWSFYIEKMANFIESQINLLNLSLQYPNSFEKPNRTKVVSPFQLSDEYTKNDLIELISALDAARVAEHKNGGSASFRELVTGFELLFNVSLANAYNKRGEVLNRKIKTTNFLNVLTKSLIEKSQK